LLFLSSPQILIVTLDHAEISRFHHRLLSDRESLLKNHTFQIHIFFLVEWCNIFGTQLVTILLLRKDFGGSHQHNLYWFSTSSAIWQTRIWWSPSTIFSMANIFFHNYRRVQSTLVLPESVALISVKWHRMVLIPNKYILKYSSPSQISKSTFKFPQYKGMTWHDGM
jgi:hypothetical protein